MTDHTVTAMFDTRGAVESAREELIGLGVDRSGVTIRSENGGYDVAPDDEEGRGFWGGLLGVFMPDDDRNLYTEGLNRGGYLLSAQVPQELADEAIDALERYEPIDLDQRSERWRREGWSGSEPGATTSTASTVGVDTGASVPPLAAATVDEEDAVQVADEESQVAKREVGRGRLRVRSYVTGRPVEEPVVSKTARVVEEIGLKKDVDRETRTVRDAVRRQDVAIEDERTEQMNPL